MSCYLHCREFAEFISFGGGLYVSLGIPIRAPVIGLLRTYALLRIKLFPFQRLLLFEPPDACHAGQVDRGTSNSAGTKNQLQPLGKMK